MQIAEELGKGEVDISPLADIFKDGKKRKEIGKEFEAAFNNFIAEFRANPINYVDSNPVKALNFAVAVAGYSIALGMKISQIRKILELMRGIKRRYEKKGEDEELRRDIYRVRFMLAYTAGRHSQMKPIVDVLEPMLLRVKNTKDFAIVYEFFQSIVAFHYFLGGREK